MAPQDLQHCGRNLRKRKQSDAEFAGNRLLGMGIIDIVINVLLGRVTDILSVLHCPWWDYAFVSSYWQDCRVAANCRYCLYSQAKNQVFRPSGATRCTDSGQLCSTDGHLGPLSCAKFHVNRCRRVGMRPPKYQKFPLFGKESPSRGDSLHRFPKFLGAFIRLTTVR